MSLPGKNLVHIAAVDIHFGVTSHLISKPSEILAVPQQIGFNFDAERSKFTFAQSLTSFPAFSIDKYNKMYYDVIVTNLIERNSVLSMVLL